MINNRNTKPFRINTVGQIYKITKDIFHYNDVIMGARVSQITSLTIIYLTVYSGADQRKH